MERKRIEQKQPRRKPPRLLRPSEVAGILRITKKTLSWLMSNCIIKAVKVGTTYRFTRAEVIRFIKENENSWHDAQF